MSCRALLALAVAVLLLVPSWPVPRAAAQGTSTRVSWGLPAPIPTPRSQLGVAHAPNGRIYAIGGFSSAGCSFPGYCNLVEEYDPATNIWRSRAPMPTPRTNFAMAVSTNGRIYVVGGDGGAAGGYLATVEEYDPVANAWRGRAPLPVGKKALGLAAASNDKLYAIGGIAQAPGTVATVDEYDPAIDSWRARAPLGAVTDDISAAGLPNGLVYAVGGRANRVEEYNPATDSWRLRSPMQVQRSGPGVAVSPQGRLFAIGGFKNGGSDSGANAAVEEYDPVADQWTVMTPLTTRRWGLGAAIAPNGRIYAIGGQQGGGVSTVLIASVEEYDPAANAFATVPNRAPLQVPRFGLGLATAPDGTLYAVGGRAGGTFLPTVERYTPSANAWDFRANLGAGERNALALVTHPNGRLYAIGGGNAAAFLGRTEEYDPVGNAWAPKANMTIARQSLGAAVGSNGLIYAAGGFNGADRPELEAFDVALNQWSTQAPMSIGRQAPALVATGDGRLFAIGGFNNGLGGPQASVEVYTIATNTWEPRAPMANARYSLGAFLGPNGRIYAVGGQTGPATMTNVAEEYEPATNTWRTIAPMPLARAGFGLALAPGGRAFAVGGYDAATTPLGAVHELTFTGLPTVDAGPSLSVPIGQTVQLSASGADPDGDALAYAWDLDGDFVYETPGQTVTFSAAGLPDGPRTVRARALDGRGAYSLDTAIVTVVCGASRRVNLQTVAIGPGRVQTTITSSFGNLQRLRLGQSGRPLQNAVVDVEGGPSNLTTAQDIALSGSQVVIVVSRLGASGPVTVPLSVSDGCGEWPSFVGFGTGV